MVGAKKWTFKEICYEEVLKISKEAGICPLLAKVLLSRDMKDPAEIRKFLNPSVSDMLSPFLLKDMDKAVERIIRAVNDKEKITVYGDYDVDGVTSTSMLYDFLTSLSACVEYYIPDRFSEGYGLSTSALNDIMQGGTSLIVTVDCGTNSFEEIEHVSRCGIDVIVTDHHECKDGGVPGAYAVVNPCRPDCEYPFKGLAGAGVTFKLIHAICIKMGLGDIHHKYLDIAAVGTIADVVPLTGENRILASCGIREIAKTSSIGLKALVDNSGIKDKAITSWSIGFVIAPRINAAGRMGYAGKAVELLTSKDPDKALEIARELISENARRQEIEAKILREVEDIIDNNEDIRKAKVIVVGGSGWHRGVIGIVASKVTEKYYRPCILISIEDGIGRGSGRSIEGFDLFKAVTHCGSLFEAYGGHELAVGITIREGRIDDFRTLINLYAETALQEETLTPKLNIDAVAKKEDIEVEAVRQLEMLAPFGQGNPAPVFAFERLKIKSMKTVGEEKHLKLMLEGEDYCVEAIGFNMGSLAYSFNHSDMLDVACLLEVNLWNGSERVQLNLKDIRFCGGLSAEDKYFYGLDKCIDFCGLKDDNKDNDFSEAAKKFLLGDFQPHTEQLVPERDDFAAVFRCFKAHPDRKFVVHNLFAFSRRIEAGYRVKMNYFKLKKIVQIFEELGLLKSLPYGEHGLSITLFDDTKEKRNLNESELFLRLQKLKRSFK